MSVVDISKKKHIREWGKDFEDLVDKLANRKVDTLILYQLDSISWTTEMFVKALGIKIVYLHQTRTEYPPDEEM